MQIFSNVLYTVSKEPAPKLKNYSMQIDLYDILHP